MSLMFSCIIFLKSCLTGFFFFLKEKFYSTITSVSTVWVFQMTLFSSVNIFSKLNHFLAIFGIHDQGALNLKGYTEI